MWCWVGGEGSEGSEGKERGEGWLVLAGHKHAKQPSLALPAPPIALFFPLYCSSRTPDIWLAGWLAHPCAQQCIPRVCRGKVRSHGIGHARLIVGNHLG